MDIAYTQKVLQFMHKTTEYYSLTRNGLESAIGTTAWFHPLPRFPFCPHSACVSVPLAGCSFTRSVVSLSVPPAMWYQNCRQCVVPSHVEIPGDTSIPFCWLEPVVCSNNAYEPSTKSNSLHYIFKMYYLQDWSCKILCVCPSAILCRFSV